MTANWIEVALEEYRALRQESLQAMQAQQTIVNYGLLVVGALLGVAFGSWTEVLPSAILLLAFVPIVCYLVLFVWLGEIARMMRVGRYLKDLENEIGSRCPGEPPPLRWENHLRKTVGGLGTSQMQWNYVAVIALFLLAALIAVGVGHFHIAARIDRMTLVWIDTVEGVVFGACVLYLIATGSRFR